MEKKLSEMSLNELWELFPIVLTEHQPCWEAWYEEERKFLEEKLSFILHKRISHIGSTAIQAIWAKPIVDILIEVAPGYCLDDVKNILQQSGYLCMNQSKDRMSFNKGYTENGYARKVYHLHLRYWGDHAEVYFRDYLNEHPQAAREYERLKLDLWKKFEHDRDGYTNAKTDFVVRCTEKARVLYDKDKKQR